MRATTEAVLSANLMRDLKDDSGKLFACKESLEFFKLKKLPDSRFKFTVDSGSFKFAKKFTFETKRVGDSADEIVINWIHEEQEKVLFSAFQSFLKESFNQEQRLGSHRRNFLFYRYILIEPIEPI